MFLLLVVMLGTSESECHAANGFAVAQNIMTASEILYYLRERINVEIGVNVSRQSCHIL